MARPSSGSMQKMLFDKGIKLRIGTDWPSGGKAFVSEQLLLSEYGFAIPEILQISTINGATALGLDNKYGSIKKGKKANLLIWDKSPFENYKNFLASKTIIKDGIVFENQNNIYQQDLGRHTPSMAHGSGININDQP